MNKLLKYSIWESDLIANDVKNRMYYLKNEGIYPDCLEDVLADLNIEEYELNEYDYNELENLFEELFR